MVRHLLQKQLIIEHLLKKTDFSVRIVQKKRRKSSFNFFFRIYFISGHKKHSESSLEPGKRENQLFMNVWDRETGKLRGFGSTSAPQTANSSEDLPGHQIVPPLKQSISLLECLSIF